MCSLLYAHRTREDFTDWSVLVGNEYFREWDRGPLTLKHIEPGNKVRIKRVTGTGRLRKRLLEMGVSPGILVEVQRVAPLGDPIEVKVRDFNLSLRKSEADAILVEME